MVESKKELGGQLLGLVDRSALIFRKRLDDMAYLWRFDLIRVGSGGGVCVDALDTNAPDNRNKRFDLYSSKLFCDFSLSKLYL